MPRFLVELQYLGKNYNGFQIQSNQNTIQGQVELALFKLFDKHIEINGCSRTDSGVNALKYYFHFDCETKLPEGRICFKLNRFLPNDIQAQSSKIVPQTFHARRSVKSKTYEYSCYISPHISPFLNRNHLKLDENINIDAMIEGANYLIGRHDFTAFRTASSTKCSPVRTINFLNITTNGNILKFSINADGFLYNMVRIIVGTLIEVGYGKIPPLEVKQILDSKNRHNAKITINPKALCLVDVIYK